MRDTHLDVLYMYIFHVTAARDRSPSRSIAAPKFRSRPGGRRSLGAAKHDGAISSCIRQNLCGWTFEIRDAYPYAAKTESRLRERVCLAAARERLGGEALVPPGASPMPNKGLCSPP